MKLTEAIKEIQPLDEQAMEQAYKRWTSIAIPLHSLGKMQDVVIRIAGISRSNDVRLTKKALVVMCADNGVVEEGISQSGQEVTLIISENFLEEKATASIMCRNAGADIFPIDIGIAVDSRLENRKVMYGTKNMAKEPAMTRDEVIKAIETGITIVSQLKDRGYRIIATGEMGIGNTASAALLTHVFTQSPLIDCTGRGTGLDDAGLLRKRELLAQAVKRAELPHDADAVTVLSEFGGFEIAMMAGALLGGAERGMTLLVDGFVATSALLVATRIAPAIPEYCIFCHRSAEPGHQAQIHALKGEPLLDMGLRLGEGTGALLAYPLICSALDFLNDMASFESAGVSQGVN